MANDLIAFLDAATGQEIVREMTNEEQAQRNAEIEAWKIEKEARLNAIESAWRVKLSAYEKLGLTAEEINALAPMPKHLRPEA